MMEHIIKSLGGRELATVIALLGSLNTARLWHKQILEHRVEMAKLRKHR